MKKANHLYNTYVLTIYRYTLLATAQLLYIIAAFMPVLQALADVTTEYYHFVKTEIGIVSRIILRVTKNAVDFLRVWFPEAINFRSEICRENRAEEYA